MLSNSVLSVDAVPVIPQSLGNCRGAQLKASTLSSKANEILNDDSLNQLKHNISNLKKEILVTDGS